MPFPSEGKHTLPTKGRFENLFREGQPDLNQYTDRTSVFLLLRRNGKICERVEIQNLFHEILTVGMVLVLHFLQEVPFPVSSRSDSYRTSRSPFTSRLQGVVISVSLRLKRNGPTTTECRNVPRGCSRTTLV